MMKKKNLIENKKDYNFNLKRIKDETNNKEKRNEAFFLFVVMFCENN